MAAAGPRVVAMMIVYVEIEAEAPAIELHGTVQVGHSEHYCHETAGVVSHQRILPAPRSFCHDSRPHALQLDLASKREPTGCSQAASGGWLCAWGKPGPVGRSPRPTIPPAAERFAAQCRDAGTDDDGAVGRNAIARE
jgi:hypothetical protein